MEFKLDSKYIGFLINFVISEFLFFIGTAILIAFKVVFNLDIEELMEGTFIGPASAAVFTDAFSLEQLDWIMGNLILWWMNVFIVYFSSLLLLTGFFALAILLPLGIEIFQGPNSIAIEAMPLGLLFLVCWGIIPTLYLVRSSFTDRIARIKNIFISVPKKKMSPVTKE